MAIEDRTATGNATSTGSADDEHASYRQVDLREMLAGNIVRVEPTILRREEDRAALLYPGRVNGIHGDSGSGKSMIAAFAAAEQIRAGHHVGWIDFEDPDASTVVERLRMFGLGDDEILERFHYYGPVEPFDEIAAQMIVADAKTYGFTLVVIDSLGEAFGLEGINEDKDNEVNPWLRRVARVIAAAASDDEHDGPAVTLIDHSTKAKDNPLYASGSKRKRAAITGASYLVTDVVPLTRENGGSVALTCAKDRHGNYRRGEIVANFWISPRDAYANPTVKLYPPRKENADDNDDDLLGQLIRAAIEAIEIEGRPLTQREMLATMNIKASDERKKAGIDGAVSLGKLRIRKGPNKAQLHELIVDEPDTL